MSTVIVSGAVANKHRHGGSIWVRMSWAEALSRLGFDVVFVEQIDLDSCVDSQGRPSPPAQSANADVFSASVEEFGLSPNAALIGPEGEPVCGLAPEVLVERARDAELLVNIGGNLRWEELTRAVGCRAYIDLDPGYTQIWDAEGRPLGLSDHDLHFTAGLNVGSPGCSVPSAGFEWRPIVQPVVLDRWATNGNGGFSGFTTVASWRGAFGRVSWGGTTYGLKAHQFRRFAKLPAAAGMPFKVALDIDPADGGDGERLTRGGWELVDPAAVATPAGFRQFVASSGAEFSPAQGVYVDTRSGWFSDRTVRYLAAGRPALVQDTGFGARIPTGAGLLTFSDLDGALAGAREIAADYAHHSAAARRLAEEHFAPAEALAPLLDAAGVAT